MPLQRQHKFSLFWAVTVCCTRNRTLWRMVGSQSTFIRNKIKNNVRLCF